MPTPAPNVSPNIFGSPNPVIPVASLSVAIDYYVNVLGFRLSWKHQDFFASVYRDRGNIFSPKVTRETLDPECGSGSVMA